MSLVVEVDVSHADAMQRMGTAVAMVRDWAYLPAQTQKSTSTYLMLPAESRLFIESIEKGLVPNTDHLQRYSIGRLLLHDNPNNSWCAAHYDKELLTLRLETSLGSASRQLTKLLSAWKFQGQDGKWTVEKAALETGSNPNNAAILTWATLLPSWTDARITGEFIGLLSLAAACSKQGDLTGVRWLRDHGNQFTSQMLWSVQQDYVLRNVNKKGKVQSKLNMRTERQDVTEPASIHLNPTGNYMPISADILCPAEPLGNSAWAAIHPSDPKTTRVISQNVGSVGLMGSLEVVSFIVKQHRPGIVFLQDCRIAAHEKSKTSAQLRRLFPQYQFFIRCGTRARTTPSGNQYKYAIVTMLHKSCGQGTELFANADNPDQGRLLTILVKPVDPKAKAFCATNVYNYTAKEAKSQLRIYRELKRRLTHQDTTQLRHVLGGDFNASLTPESRSGSANSKTEQADALMSEFVRDQVLANRWWSGRIREGIWTRRHPSLQQAARIDEILLLDPQELDDDPDDRRSAGKTYSLRTALTCNAQLDHRTVMADIPAAIVPRPHHHFTQLRREVPDMAEWQLKQDDWRLQVQATCEKVPAQQDVFAELQRWSQAAVAVLPTKSIITGGPSRIPHASNSQRRYTKQIHLLERELVIAEGGQAMTDSTKSMRKIVGWPSEAGLSAIIMPQFPLSPEITATWTQSLRKGVSERRKTLQTSRREQQKENLQSTKDQCRDRMDRPGEREIKRLLGQTMEKTAVPLRMSKIVSKRHPDKIDGRMSKDKWENWLVGVLGVQLVSEFGRIWDYQRDADEAVQQHRLAQGDITIELTKMSNMELRVRVSPLHLITELMTNVPMLDKDEFVRVSQSELVKLAHKSDTLCHEECFFATNALDVHAYCAKCNHISNNIIPMTQVQAQGRLIRYLCIHCNVFSDHPPAHPLPPCPVPAQVLRDRGFNPKERVITNDISREDFDYWLRKLPKRKSAGEDAVSYEMWQQGPAGMKEALFQAVRAAVRNGKIPTEWEGALVKLLSKKAGEEGTLEHNRPICLLQTAAKIVTAIWAHRLALASETKGVMEGAQEGFRRDRSTKRQAVRLLSCINAVRERQGRVVVAFLDFENYFNVISLPALFMILREMGLSEYDVEALECYYSRANMQVVNDDGTASAKIPLRRGLRQGCPLSPILGGMMVNTMIRWLETYGGGVQHGSGIVTNNLCFADDTTLITEGRHSLLHMNVLLDCMHQFCTWAGIRINMSKSEATAYDFRRQVAIPTASLRIGEGKPTCLLPHEPFKYLGLRLKVAGGMEAERMYVIRRSKELTACLTKHQYHPQQIHWVVQTSIVSIFRYSAALAEWDHASLTAIQTVWAQAQKKAWKLPANTPVVTVMAGQAHGGIDMPTAEYIITRETIGLMRQCTALDDDLHDMIKIDMCQTVLSLGVQTIQEAQDELRWKEESWNSTTSFTEHFLQCTGRGMRVVWDSILTVRRGDESCPPILAEMTRLQKPGLLSIMPHQAQDGWPERKWRAARNVLTKLAKSGHNRLEDVSQQGVFRVPAVLRPADTDVVKILQQVATHATNKDISWEAGTATSLTAAATREVRLIRPGDVGEKLIAGAVHKRSKRTHVTGAITSYDEQTDLYTVTFQNSTCERWNLQQVCNAWAHAPRPFWTRADQLAISSQVVQVYGSRTLQVKRQLKTPFPTCLTSDTWQETNTWYTCAIRWAFKESVRMMLVNRGIAWDRRVAQELCDTKAVFWAPTNTWQWASTSASNVAGWLVQAESTREEDGAVYVHIRSLHQEEQHRWGEIRMTSVRGGISIRSIDIQHADRTGLMISMSAAELGDPEAGGYKQCAALTQYLARTATAILPTTPPETHTPIIRRQRELPHMLRKACFQLDMTALYPTDEIWPGLQTATTVTSRGGQATRHVTGVAPKQTNVKRTLKSASRQKKAHADNMPIEAPRWALLKKWYRPEEVLHKWKREWSRTTTWEEQGGRTISWAVTSAIRDQLTVDCAVRGSELTLDPSFSVLIDSIEQHDVTMRCYLPLYEMTANDSEATLQTAIERRLEWVAIIAEDRVTQKQRTLLRRHASRIFEYSKGDNVCLRKGWWMTGERKPVKSPCHLSVWRAKTGQWEPLHLPTSDEALRWRPARLHQSGNLQCYMNAMPGAKYRSGPNHVAATDGSLRLNRNGTEEPTMGAGVVWDQNHADTVAVRIGGMFSSTRPELAGIALALQQAAAMKTLVLLVDSAAALLRMRWLRSDDFRPLQHKVTDVDILQDIIHYLDQRQIGNSNTIIVKVFGHSGDPVHEGADLAAVTGASTELKENEKPCYPNERQASMCFRWTDPIGKERVEPWNTRIARHTRAFEAECRWKCRKTGSHAEIFLARHGAAREVLGKAIRYVGDWALREWILSLTPYQYPVRLSFKKWHKTQDATCECGKGEESLLHLQLKCTLPHRKNTRQTAHNKVALALERHVEKTSPKHWVAVWDKSTTKFLTSIAETPGQAAFLNELTPADMRDWDKMIAKYHSASRRQAEALTPQVGRKRDLNEIEETMPPDTKSKRPDGLIFDSHQRKIYVIEVARTSDDVVSLRNKFVGKVIKYGPLLKSLRECFRLYQVVQLTFVIGIQGSVDSEVWRRQLRQLGLSDSQQNNAIKDCMMASIEGMHSVLRAKPLEKKIE